jgi:MFS transporter, AAHS family, 4-hydroxybenzoate transporter
MPAPARILDVQEVVNAHPLSRFQKTVIALCFLVVAIDGFDTAAIGFIAPSLKADGASPPPSSPRSSPPASSG